VINARLHGNCEQQRRAARAFCSRLMEFLITAFYSPRSFAARLPTVRRFHRQRFEYKPRVASHQKKTQNREVKTQKYSELKSKYDKMYRVAQKKKATTKLSKIVLNRTKVFQ